METSGVGIKKALFNPQFLLLTLSSFFFFVGIRMYPVFLPVFVEQSLGGSASDIGILFGLTPLIAIFSRFPMGRYIDVHGRKTILLLGAAIYVLTPILYSVAPNIGFFAVFRIIQGIGIAAFTVASLAMAIDLAPKEHVGETVGIFSVASMLAMAIGPMIAGGLVDYCGYVITFYMISGVSFIALCLCLFIRERFTPQQSVIKPHFKDVIIDINLKGACLASFFLEFTYNVIAVFIPLYMASLLYGASDIGAFFSFYAIATIVSRPLSGRISDRISRSKVILPMMLAGAIAIGLISIGGSLTIFGIGALLYGFTFGAAFSPTSAMAVDTINPRVKGVALAVYFSFVDLGLTIGASSMGFFAQEYGYNALFQADAIILLIGVIGFYIISRSIHIKPSSVKRTSG